MSNGRREVISITIKFEGGKEWNWPSDSGEELPKAIFFDNEWVKILKDYYKDKDIKIKKDKVEGEWGNKITTAVFGTATEKKIDKKVIDDAWTTPDEENLTLPMLRKTTGCPFG